MTPFTDPEAVAAYAEGPTRQVPGFRDMQTMAALLLAETVPPEGNVLVLGAGGGLEIKVFAGMQPGWCFLGVDPAEPMLDLARTTLGPLMSRVRFHHGFVDAASEGPFDGATAILVLHFLDEEQRRHTLSEIHRRLKPGAAFVIVHHSIPQEPSARKLWLGRYAEFAVASGADPDKAHKGAEMMAQQLPFLSPQADEDMLRDAGFVDVQPFYAAFTFRGWVARRP